MIEPERPGEAVSARANGAGVQRWCTDEGDTVAYVDTGSAWVAVGSPAAPQRRRAAVAHAFCASARQHQRRACFFGVEDETWCGELQRLPLGLQPIFKPATWRASLSAHRRLREQLRRARAKGIVIRAVCADELAVGTRLRAAVDDLAEGWLASRRMEPLGFVVALDSFRQTSAHHFFAAHVGARLVAFLSVAPTSNGRGWLVEDMLRSPDAPNGTAEALFDAVCRTLDDDEAVTMGLAPLAGDAWWQRLVRATTRPLYDFEGLARFKRRLHPQAWQTVWLVTAPNVAIWRALIDCLSAFASGPLWRFGLRTLLRRAGGFPYALAVPLAPWTAALYVLALTRHVGPLGFSGAALWGWSVFDSVLVLGMFSAAYRPRFRLLALLTGAAALDAMVSVAHVARVGLGATPLAALLRIVATGAPVVAAFALAWSARTHARAATRHLRGREQVRTPARA